MTRVGNDMSLDESLATQYGYASGVRGGDLLFCSGQVGLEADGTLPSDPTRQYELAFEALGAVLAQHGLGPADVVDLTSFHTDYPNHMGEFMGAKLRFQAGSLPAWTAIGVAALALPGTLVEIKAVARFAN